MKRDSDFWSIVGFPFDSKNEIFAKFSRIPKVEKVISENDGNSITIIHARGAHIINKQEVLDCNFSSDLGSPYHKKLNSDFHGFLSFKLFLLFAIFSGFISMLFSFFPLNYFVTSDSESYSNPNIYASGWGKLLALLIILIVSYCLTILFDWVLNMLLKYYRIKSNIGYYERDVLNIKLNNNFIQIRTGNWKEKLEFLNDYDREFREPNSSFYRMVIKPSYTHLVIVIVMFSTMVLFNYKTPFWFYQLPESNDVGSQIMNKVFGDNSESLKYWEYYASSDSWDSSNQPIIKYNANPIRAFYDGVVSGLIFPIFLLVVILAVLLLLLFAIAIFVLQILGDGFGGLLAFVLFLIVRDSIINNSKNWRSIKILNRIIGFFHGYGWIPTILFLIPFFIIGIRVYELGESMIGENYKYFSWSGSFLLILSTFLVVKKGIRKRDKIIKSVSEDGLLLKFQKFRYLKDKGIVLMAVKSNGLSLQYANDELKNDKEIVEVAIKQDYSSFQFASEELKNDPHLKAIYTAEKQRQEDNTDLGWEIDWNELKK
jgi:hypothetical protein